MVIDGLWISSLFFFFFSSLSSPITQSLPLVTVILHGQDHITEPTWISNINPIA